MRSPTSGAVTRMKKLISHLKETRDYTTLKLPTAGVVQVGSHDNVRDIGIKPLSRQRLTLLLYWLGFLRRDGEPVGEEEAVRAIYDVKGKGDAAR